MYHIIVVDKKNIDVGIAGTAFSKEEAQVLLRKAFIEDLNRRNYFPGATGVGIPRIPKAGDWRFEGDGLIARISEDKYFVNADGQTTYGVIKNVSVSPRSYVIRTKVDIKSPTRDETLYTTFVDIEVSRSDFMCLQDNVEDSVMKSKIVTDIVKRKVRQFMQTEGFCNLLLANDRKFTWKDLFEMYSNLVFEHKKISRGWCCFETAEISIIQGSLTESSFADVKWEAFDSGDNVLRAYWGVLNYEDCFVSLPPDVDDELGDSDDLEKLIDHARITFCNGETYPCNDGFRYLGREVVR